MSPLEPSLVGSMKPKSERFKLIRLLLFHWLARAGALPHVAEDEG